MLVASKPAQDKRSARLPASNEMGWLTAVAVAFLMVHPRRLHDLVARFRARGRRDSAKRGNILGLRLDARR